MKYFLSFLRLQNGVAQNYFRKIFSFILTGSLVSAPYAITTGETKFIIRIAQDPHAKSREIQWLQKADDPEELSSEETQTLEGDVLELPEPLAPYFRLRARNHLELAGPWSPVYRSEDFLETIVSPEPPVEPEPEPEPEPPEMQLIFAGDKSYLKDGLISFPLDSGGEIWLSLNKQPEFLYKEEIKLEHNQEYELEMIFRNKKGKELSRQVHRFKTDLIAPKTRRIVYSPAFRGRQICLTAESKIIFFASDQNSGVAETMCRFSQEEEFRSCLSPVTLPSTFDKNCRNCITLEYYSVDHAGNKEKTRSEKFGVLR